jgi:hypothetical protein
MRLEMLGDEEKGSSGKVYQNRPFWVYSTGRFDGDHQEDPEEHFRDTAVRIARRITSE